MTEILMSDAFKLKMCLERKYGKRISIDLLSVMGGNVDGTLDSKKFSITYKEDQYLLVSTNSNSRDVLDELTPFLTEILGYAKPICSYDLQNEGMKEEEAMPTIEWDMVSPEDRIKEIVNGRAFSNGATIRNLKLYNSKSADSYLESDKEKEDRIKSARIYGIDPGSIKDVETINHLSEVYLYFYIDAMAAHIWRCYHDMSYGRIQNVDLTDELYALEYMVYQTTKFGVELPKPAVGKHVSTTPSYNAWYQFYSNHFKKFLTEEQWLAFQQAIRNGEDISAFMPSGHWAELLEKPVARN